VSNSETIDYLVQPAEFMNLRSGGIHPDHPEDDLRDSFKTIFHSFVVG
jgi:hypothetical protein